MSRVIMVQGTMSSAGKSFLAAGLCRIFKEDGLSVAPFKSQNMALNSYITEEGLEMGRAQVMQAEAAGIRPEAAMNPVLLKPTSHMGSQVIVNGEVLGNYSAAEYFKMKKSLVPEIKRAYDSLAERFDVIVVEGAGSPAEINLRENDIVNMGLAELIDAPVLLAGDIDRGGVFAQLYGTAALVSDRERARIRAFIINKFRGDKEILKPGLSMLYERCPIPVAGVVPYMDVDLDDEDSLADRLRAKDTAMDRNGRKAFARIAVVRLPRISNFTDFNALEHLPGVALYYSDRPEELSAADLVILPGTKNTMGDLKWLRETGMEAAIQRKYGEGCFVFGVCGGFQMLGMRLSDPFGVEEGGTLRGLGLRWKRSFPGKTRPGEGIASVFEAWGEAAARAQDMRFTWGDQKIRRPALCQHEEKRIRPETGQPQRTAASGPCGGTYVHGF
ncbi:MAG: cobyric acid synthase [Enterocloster sp.]